MEIKPGTCKWRKHATGSSKLRNFASLFESVVRLPVAQARFPCLFHTSWSLEYTIGSLTRSPSVEGCLYNGSTKIELQP